jgi:glycosyltransferase involved in cell wall biosynthesis
MDREQFARRIDELLKNKILGREMGARGRQLLRDKFNFDQYISGLEQMFARMTNSSKQSEPVEANGHARV